MDTILIISSGLITFGSLGSILTAVLHGYTPLFFVLIGVFAVGFIIINAYYYFYMNGDQHG